MPHPIVRTYLSLSAFYASDARRHSSRERDLGLLWRARNGPTFRAAWVETTREVYLFQHALGAPGSGCVHLLAPELGVLELERRLAGWREICGQPGSLEWLLSRMGDGEPIPPLPRFRRSRGRVIRFGGPAGAAA